MSRPRNIPEPVRKVQREVSDPAMSAFVGANAGSGKTHVLAQRVINLLLKGNDPGKILCITFTKAAAANMAMLWVLNLSDGSHTLLDIAERADLPFPLIRRTSELLLKNELLEPATA